MLYTYEGTKNRGVTCIRTAANALAYSNNHEANKELIQVIIDAAKLLLQTEDIQIAYEKCDLEALIKAGNNKY